MSETVKAPRPKALEIGSHDTKRYMGRRSLRERAATAALNQDAKRGGAGSERRVTAREVLEEVVAEERAKGRKHRSRLGSSTRRGAERAVLSSQALVDPLARLKLDTQLAGERYMDLLKSSGIVEAGQGTSAKKKKQTEKLTGIHAAYGQMMALAALAPLRNGLSGSAVVRTMGMGAAMFALSPSFRSTIGGMRPRLLTGIKGRMKEREARKDQKALDKLGRAEARGKGRSSLSQKWQDRLDRIERGGREPMTVRSAALTEIALTESAYAALRDPRVSDDMREKHQREVMESYETAINTLNGFISEDGLGREAVSKEARTIIGLRLEAEPELASVFAETAHGRFVRSEPREMYVAGSDKKVMAWTGEFVDAVTDRQVSRGSFSLRVPGSEAEHAVLCAQTLEGELEDCSTLEDLNDVFSSYAAASVVRKFPGMAEEVEDPDVRQRMARTESMFASMRADGMSQTDQRNVYASAFVDAMEAVAVKKPELLAQWEGQYGPEWQADVKGAVSYYSDLGRRIEKDRLADILLNRGYTAVEVDEALEEHLDEVDANPSIIETASEISTEEMGPRDPSALEGEFVVPRAREGMTDQDRIMEVVESLAERVSEDALREFNREGIAIVDHEGGTAPLGKGFFVGEAMDGYEGNPESDQSDPRYMERQRTMNTAREAFQAIGLNRSTSEALAAASYVRGLELAALKEPTSILGVEHKLIVDGRDNLDWREECYSVALKGESLPVGKHAAKFGYASWSEQFKEVEKRSVEPDQAESESARSQAMDEVSTLTEGSAERRRARRRQKATSEKVKVARINREYNEVETGGLLGIGSDEAAPLQQEDPTLGL